MVLGSLLALVAVAAGAFGAHVLKLRLSSDLLEIFELAVRYHMYHSLALLAAGLVERSGGGVWARRAGYGFLAGILVFSGSLYALALTGVRGLGAVTPLGGVAFLFGWGCLAAAALKLKGEG